MFHTFDHTADLGLHIEAPSFKELIAEAGRALCSVLISDISAVRPTETRHVAISGSEPELLLFDWLTELLYWYDTEKFLAAEFSVTPTENGLEITCHGEPVDLAQHRLEHEVKAITYHGLSVSRTAVGFVAEVIVDI